MFVDAVFIVNDDGRSLALGSVDLLIGIVKKTIQILSVLAVNKKWMGRV